MPEITTPDSGLVAFRQDVHKLLRRRVLEAMEIVLEEELSEALGSTRYERSDSRRGYRNGSEKRTVTTSLGATPSFPARYATAPPFPEKCGRRSRKRPAE